MIFSCTFYCEFDRNLFFHLQPSTPNHQVDLIAMSKQGNKFVYWSFDCLHSISSDNVACWNICSLVSLQSFLSLRNFSFTSSNLIGFELLSHSVWCTFYVLGWKPGWVVSFLFKIKLWSFYSSLERSLLASDNCFRCPFNNGDCIIHFRVNIGALNLKGWQGRWKIFEVLN